MKKTQKTKKYMGILLVIAMLISGLTACKSTEDAEQGANDATEVMIQESHYMGEITEMEGNQITVNVMGGGRFGGDRMPEGEAPEGFNPEEMPSEMPEGFEAGERPEGKPADGERAENFNPSEMPSEFEQGKMPEAEQMVIEVTEDTVITVNDENSEVSYLQVGDFIQFTMEDEVVTEIRVGMPQQGTQREDMPQQIAPQEKTE